MLAASGHDKVLKFELKRIKMAAMTQIFPQTLWKIDLLQELLLLCSMLNIEYIG